MFDYAPSLYLKSSAVHRNGIKVRPQSLIPAELELFAFETSIAKATGFFVTIDHQTWLVSNGHVFSGRHSETNKSLSSQLAKPTEVRVRFLPKKDRRLPNIGSLVYTVAHFPLYSDDKPTWYQHEEGAQVDVAAVQVGVESHLDPLEPYAIDRTTGSVRSLVNRAMEKIKPGAEVFVVGFPLGLTGQALLPIWKRGTIASEPLTIENRVRSFLIDCATRSGLSGSPVFIEHVEDGDSYLVPIGLYSARKQKVDRFDSEIGIVYPLAFIDSVLASGTKPPTLYET